MEKTIDLDLFIIKIVKPHNSNNYNLSRLADNFEYLFKLVAKLGTIRDNLKKVATVVGNKMHSGLNKSGIHPFIGLADANKYISFKVLDWWITCFNLIKIN